MAAYSRSPRPRRGWGSWRSNGETQAEAGALADPAVDGDGPAMLPDDSLSHGQAQAGAAGFGRKEGLKEVRQVLLGDALAGVRDGDADAGGHSPRACHSAGFDRQCAA